MRKQPNHDNLYLRRQNIKKLLTNRDSFFVGSESPSFQFFTPQIQKNNVEIQVNAYNVELEFQVL